ncbi:unnamed protein product, partial [Soboliphyme baturini]|uniref:WD_REPEATS_REGION domain-containing protein n=1 Tax=Soboliphyme baturini TaxID=241478 RepID=A0A183J6U0_9BILA
RLISGDGEIYIWDVNSRTCQKKFFDKGCVSGLSLALSNDDRFLAAGSASGVVNVYNNQTVLTERSPKPVKVLMNLTTQANVLRFNPQGEILAFGSYVKFNSLKLVSIHIFPTFCLLITWLQLNCAKMTVFQNFPLVGNIGSIQCADFSLNSGYMCLGNFHGNSSLYRISEYDSY